MAPGTSGAIILSVKGKTTMNGTDGNNQQTPQQYQQYQQYQQQAPQPQPQPQPPQKKRLPFWLGILVGVAAASILAIMFMMLLGFRSLIRRPDASQSSYSAGASYSGSGPVDSALEKIDSVQDLVDKYYLWDIDNDYMEEKIIDGYVSGLNDKYALYYTPEEFEELQESVSGSYAGIGVSIVMNDENRIEVYKVFSGSPAEKAGIFVGDIIVSANGESGFATLDDLVAIVRGLPGTTVDLVIDRGGKEIPMTVERARIQVETVEYRMIDDKIGYIYISEFETVTVEQFNAAIDALFAQGMEKIILDLRDNPGGDYDTVVAMSDRVLPEGPIMTVKDKDGTIITENSDAEHSLQIPMAILINGNSASASEVFVGAIQDYDMAVIIGTQSYGKGIVQSIFSLPDGSGVKFTTQEYYTPSGDSIHGVGITPDIVIEIPEEAYEDGVLEDEEDTQLQKAIEELKKQ